MSETRIRICWPAGELHAVLQPTPTSARLLEALPAEAGANVWGEEVYFSIPMSAALEPDARQVVEPGTVCFWVEGRSLALPYGPTPVSHGSECRLVTKVNVLGMIEGDARTLSSVREGDRIRVERL